MVDGILAGIRVLDLTQASVHPALTQMLSDHGAEIIDIRDDPNGTTMPGTKSVVLDLDAPDGLAAFHRLSATSHVVLAETDHTYERLSADNPALVYVVIAGGTAVSGGDLAFGVMAALRHAEATGQGQIVILDATDDEVSPIFSAMPTPPRKPAPRIGEHTDSYLAEMPLAPMLDTDRRALRDAFGCFATGVTVVTTRQEDGVPRGFTANSFTSVSLDPPMLLVCVAKTAHSCPVFTDAPHFAVNVLSQDQKDLSGIFASRETDKFEQVPWRSGVARMPVFDGALAHLVCACERIMDAGDHVILLGRVIGHETGPGQPLGYFRGTYFSAGNEQDLIDAASHGGDIEIGALIEGEGALLLANASGGGLEVPKAPGIIPDIDVLTTLLQQAGLTVDLDFLYAVFRDSATGRYGIFYHGTASGTPPQGHQFYPMDDLPLSRVRNAAERSMLTRYVAEHQQGSFGIYQGDETRGTVHRIASHEPSTY